MAKFELIEKTEINGEVWYSIHRDGRYVDNSHTKHIEEATQMFHELANGTRRSVPIIKIIKTIENASN